jgi:hypothetical protein
LQWVNFISQYHAEGIGSLLAIKRATAGFAFTQNAHIGREGVLPRGCLECFWAHGQGLGYKQLSGLGRPAILLPILAGEPGNSPSK